MTISLRDVTEDNFEALMDMELPEHQRDLLHSNAYSIAQARFYDVFVPRAIYQGERPAGFALYNREDDGRPGCYGIASWSTFRCSRRASAGARWGC